MEKNYNCKLCQYFKEKMEFEINEFSKHSKFGYCFKKHAYILKYNNQFYLLKPRSMISSKELQKLNELHLYRLIIGKYYTYIPIPIQECNDSKKKITISPEI